MNVAAAESTRISAYELDRLTPDLDPATVEDLAFRLSGLSGMLLELECIRLADAMLEDMANLGYVLGRLEHTLVLALLRAAVDRNVWTQVGRA